MLEMIQFLAPPLVACSLSLFILGYLGIHVLKRQIIFIDIALAQVAAVGATFSHIVFHTDEEGLLTSAVAFMFTIAASLFFSQIGKRIHQISHEAIIGVSYAIAAAAALFILALAAGGDVHMEHMLTGSILWAQWIDIAICSGVLILVGVFHIIFRKNFIQLSENYEIKLKKEKNAVWWDFLFYVSMGLVITISVKMAGVLVIFAFLIIPGTISAIFASSWLKRLIIAYAIGLFCIVCGLVFSFKLDFSCGPSVVTFLGLGLIIAALTRRYISKKHFVTE